MFKAKTTSLIESFAEAGGYVYVRYLGTNQVLCIVERRHGSQWVQRRQDCSFEEADRTMRDLLKHVGNPPIHINQKKMKKKGKRRK